MILIIILVILVTLIAVPLIEKHGSLSLWMLGMFVGTLLITFGYMLSYAKLGGISDRFVSFIYLNRLVLREMQYAIISMDMISRMMSIGRSVFMYFTMGFAITMNLNSLVRARKTPYLFALVLPAVHAIFYEPTVYKALVARYGVNRNGGADTLFRLMIFGYMAVTIFLIARHYRTVSIQWIRKKLKYIFLEILNLELLFLLFSISGTMQVAEPHNLSYFFLRFHRNTIGYSLVQWYVIVFAAIIFSVIGTVALWKYTRIDRELGKPDVSLNRKLKSAHAGVRVLIHGIKNQLLAEGVVLRKLTARLREPQPAVDSIRGDAATLVALNTQMLDRIDRIYRTFKSNVMELKPESLHTLLDAALKAIGPKPDTVGLVVTDYAERTVLADRAHLSEALRNIMVNAVDAVVARPVNVPSGKVELSVSIERLWIILAIADNGIGIKKQNINRIFDPFYTEKNTNHNWGLGLSYVQQIVQAHFGHLRIESTLNAGTTFYVFLPVYHHGPGARVEGAKPA